MHSEKFNIRYFVIQNIQVALRLIFYDKMEKTLTLCLCQSQHQTLPISTNQFLAQWNLVLLKLYLKKLRIISKCYS